MTFDRVPPPSPIMRLPCCRTRIEDEAEDARPLRQDVTSDEQPGVSPASPAWAKRDTALNHSALFRVKERVQCFFEGGRACRKEDPKAHKGANAVRGVHSDWVGKSIIAAARPQQPIVEREGTLEDMLAKNVKGIVNLQEIGEHAHCGSGILDHTGFSYDPDYFMQVGKATPTTEWAPKFGNLTPVYLLSPTHFLCTAAPSWRT